MCWGRQTLHVKQIVHGKVYFCRELAEIVLQVRPAQNLLHQYGRFVCATLIRVARQFHFHTDFSTSIFWLEKLALDSIRLTKMYPVELACANIWAFALIFIGKLYFS